MSYRHGYFKELHRELYPGVPIRLEIRPVDDDVVPGLCDQVIAVFIGPATRATHILFRESRDGESDAQIWARIRPQLRKLIPPTIPEGPITYDIRTTV